MIVKQQRPYISLPVKLNRPWSSNPLNQLTVEFFKKFLARSKQFIETVVAVLLGLISVVMLSMVSGIALHNSLQTKHYVEAWHKDSHELWSQQDGIDAE